MPLPDTPAPNGSLPAVRVSSCRKLAVTCLLWFAYDLAWCANVRALAVGALLPAVAISFATPFLLFLSSVWFIEAKGMRARLGLTAAGAVGSAAGTALVLWLW
jgi:hypothetical protein